MLNNKNKNLNQVTIKSKSKNYFGFTLVELIIVIVILAILATIAFLSFNSYSSSSRDSVRLSDINSLNKSLELFNISAAKYPDPTSVYTRVVYSGGVIFEQGSVGDSVITAVQKVSKKPIDPLDSGEYTYSTNLNRTSFQLKGTLENKLSTGYNDNPPDSLSFVFPLNKGDMRGIEGVNADTNSGSRICYVKGNFNGLIEKTNTGNTNYILAVPGLIVNETNLNLDYNTLSGKVVCNGANTPCIITYTPTLVFVGTGNSVPTTSTQITDIMTNLQSAYSGSNSMSTNSTISTLLNSSGDSLTSLGTSLVAKAGISTAGSIVVTNSSCTLSGVTVPHLSTIDAYSENSIIWSAGYDCTSRKLIRTCNNGVLSGDSSYKYDTCIKGTANNCSAGSYSGTTTQTYTMATSLNHSLSYTGSKSVGITNGTKVYSAQLNCNDGVITVLNETIVNNCDTNFTWNGTMCAANTRVFACSGIIGNASRNTASSITQTWNGSARTPTTVGTYNTTSSTTSCNYKCSTNFTRNGTACVANTQVVACTGLPDDNSQWNTASSITQTWNGSARTPSNVGTYNTTASSTSCVYKCHFYNDWTGYNCIPDSYTKLLLRFDGDASNKGSNGGGVSNNGGVTFDSPGKFSNAAYFAGSNYLTVPSSSDWDFGNGNFTIDFWMYPTSFPAMEGIFVHTQTETTHGFWIDLDGGQLRFFSRSSNVENFTEMNTYAVVLNQRQHIAIVRNGNTFTMYINGNSIKTATSSVNFPVYSAPLQIGNRTGYGSFQGYLDEFRVSKGIARRTGNFTPESGHY